LGWSGGGVKPPLAHSVISSLYAENAANEFWDRIGQPEFLEWSASHTPMTEWVARKALAAVAHAPFYKPRVMDGCAGPVSVVALAYDAPELFPVIQDQVRPVRILTVGLINKTRRVQSVIEVIAASPILRTRCEYNIVGQIETSYRIALEAQIDKLKLNNVVRLHGYIDDAELGNRFSESDIVCCLRLPALEGASAACIEAMLHGKAVLVSDTGFYSSIPSDIVLKIRPTDEDLRRNLEMLVVDPDRRRILGRRAKDWAELEYAPDTYVQRIEPLFEAALAVRPLFDTLRQITPVLRSLRVQPEDSIVRQIGSEFQEMFVAERKKTNMESEPTRADPAKSVSNMLREPLPEPMGSGTKSEAVSEGLKVPAQQDGGKHEQRSAGSRARAALWKFAVFCTEPILSRLRNYLLWNLNRSTATLIELTRSANRRAAATSHAVDALRERTETLARREEFENLAKQLAALESRSNNANRLIEIFLSRNVLIFGDAVVARTPSGYLLAPNDDLSSIFALVEGERHKSATWELLDLALNEEMTFIDVGAHIGVHTLHAARRVGPSGTVIAFEPTPDVFNLLQRSIHLNGLEKWCRCVNVAATSTEGNATLHMSLDSQHNSLYSLGIEEKASVGVRTAALDNVLQGIKRIHVVKISAQGTELDVLEGMKQILSDHRDLLLIVDYQLPHLDRLGLKPSDWFRRFLVHGFDLFSMDEQGDRWLHVPEESANQLRSTTVAFVRPETMLWTILRQHEK
ncbi:MAG: FkbM family methyltransferase, partial [Verrucomicrobia bacterium]|nr:FkbM family methyltransferase [Verrucomicrobiota bacterium]